MLLNIEDVSFFDLVCILFSPDLKKRKFVDCPDGHRVEGMTKRWIIILSVLLQMFLKLVSKPLSRFGSMLEYWLNLCSSNGSFFGLLSNFLRGKVVQVPGRASETFVTIIGNLDTRVELDKKIKPGDVRYGSLLAVMASKLTYENKAFIESVVTDHWEMEFLGFYDFWNEYQEKTKTQAFMFHDKQHHSDLIIVAFRGTEFFDADMWCTDVDLSWYELPGIGRVHGGFMKALGLQKSLGWPKEIKRGDDQREVAYYAIREKLKELLKKNHHAKFIVTGHSLGGALAILFPSILALHEEKDLLERMEGVYTFGQPRVGDDKFGKYMTEEFTKHNVKYYRTVYCNDIVARVPFDDKAFMFKHFGTCLYFNGFYKGKIVEEEPNMNYFTLFGTIPKKLNATWEILRSFLIPLTKGSDYKEGTVLRVARVSGLLVSGLADHGPQDYVNSIRLGSKDLYKHHK